MEQPTYQTERVWTLPNVLSFLRLAGVPLFVWLVISRQGDVWAVVLLMVAGATDWLDGFLARRWNQVSRVGQMLDPVADRLYILAIIVAMAVRDLVPWWLVALLVARDLVLLAQVPALKTRGYTSLPVHFLGKAATFCLLYAFPLVLLGDGSNTFSQWCQVIGWAFAIWGTGLYWWAGLLYLKQTVTLVRTLPPVADPARLGRTG
ncbi:CDP-alcohol phosphatidyltransferase family protein [Aestuariimicrobium ganziense]|uniref:CDP-alcohol phosphatidyltransferase family protein n=1 Tax=Aestuariimicrobium ganziense TaxID=2773677 RepID=UPI0019445F2B|nr:CDP-alcohol phosphatidyltransferase family protein [Aestuariimicrobium ganziense]